MQATQQPTEWASDAEIAAQFSLTTAQLRDASRRGEFPAPIKFGRAHRYHRPTVQAWVQAQTAGAGAAVQEVVA